MGFKFMSELHVFNILKKGLLKRNITLTSEEGGRLKEIIAFSWDVRNDSVKMAKLRRCRAYDPVGTLTWLLYEEEYTSSREFINILEEVVRQFERLLDIDDGKVIDNETLDSCRYVLKDYRILLPGELINGDFDDGYLKSFVEEMESLSCVWGVYFLYNSKKEVIYVGKSIDLGSRIVSSVTERKAVYYEYARTESMSDISVYESYYISRLKPSLNVEGKHSDELTVILPDIRDYEVKPVYGSRCLESVSC